MEGILTYLPSASQSLDLARVAPHREPKVFLDCGNYFGDNTNIGDEAVLRGIAAKFIRFLPSASVRIATFDPAVIHRTCPFFEPETLTAREDHYSADFHKLIAESDIVGVIFAGAFSDSFAEHALMLLHTLDLAADMGRPTVVFSAGFEHVTNPQLLDRARAVLPKVNWILCREAEEGPHLLREWGVPKSQILIPGDAAIPEAHRYMRAELGRDIGLSLRLAPYSGLDEAFLKELEAPLARITKSHQGELVGIPISLHGPSDMEALTRFCEIVEDPAEFYDPVILASKIARCRVVVSGTYHGAVFALAQGIPVIALAGSPHYRTKLGGLREMFPEACHVLEPGADFAERLTREVENQWIHAPSIRRATLDRVREVVRIQEECWAGESGWVTGYCSHFVGAL